MNGSIKDYLLHFGRYFFCSNKTQEKVLGKVKKIIQKYSPDICCFAEIDKGSKVGNRIRQIERLVDEKYKYYDIENKYGQKSLLRKFPILSGQGNGFLSSKNFKFKKHYFKNGTKKLIYEIEISPNLSLFLAHFALGEKTRAMQFKELEKIIPRKKECIICGDFNIFKGFKELEGLIENANLKIANKENTPTYPTVNPKKTLDLFLCSKNLKIKKVRVLQAEASDHLPVLIEI